jgi:hypothetical protein
MQKSKPSEAAIRATDDTSPKTEPPRRRGGQELPDKVHNRPEQNAGYDAAVRWGPAGEVQDDLGIDLVRGDGRDDVTVLNPEAEEEPVILDIDEQAERSAIQEVKRREKK